MTVACAQEREKGDVLAPCMAKQVFGVGLRLLPRPGGGHHPDGRPLF